MSRITRMALAAVALALPLSVAAQVRNESLSNGIIEARQKDAALMRQYGWSCRTEVLENGQMQDLRIDQVTLGPDGQPQRTLVNDEPAKLPFGFFRRAIAKGKQEKLEKSVKGLEKLLGQYTLPSAGAVVNYLAQAQVQPITSPSGTTLLEVNGSNVVTPGDTFSMTIDGKSLRPTGVQITTTFDGDQVTASATFRTLPSGLNHMQYATIQVPSKNLTVMIHNYDYFQND